MRARVQVCEMTFAAHIRKAIQRARGRANRKSISKRVECKSKLGGLFTRPGKPDIPRGVTGVMACNENSSGITGGHNARFSHMALRLHKVQRTMQNRASHIRDVHKHFGAKTFNPRVGIDDLISRACTNVLTQGYKF